MQIDYHYYVIRILAEKAGFNASEAQTIAYASQFVDDATEFSPMQLPENINIDHPRIKDGEFDPICSAHKGLQFLGDFKKEVQMKIYFSFHFLPPEVYSGQKKYDYITKPDSNFSHVLLDNIRNNFKDRNKLRIYKLISLGVAVHTYADTWAHQGFSGRHNTKDNAVNKIQVWKRGQWEKISMSDNLRNKLLPQIGHAEAYSYPDFPFQNWKYKAPKRDVLRSNLNIFLDASEKIYYFLSELSPKKALPFDAFSGRLIKALSFISHSVDKRIKMYHILFPEIGFYYDSREWKENALRDNSRFISTFLEKDQVDYRWFEFHRAAFDQRNFILERVKPL